MNRKVTVVYASVEVFCRFFYIIFAITVYSMFVSDRHWQEPFIYQASSLETSQIYLKQ